MTELWIIVLIEKVETFEGKKQTMLLYKSKGESLAAREKYDVKINRQCDIKTRTKHDLKTRSKHGRKINNTAEKQTRSIT